MKPNPSSSGRTLASACLLVSLLLAAGRAGAQTTAVWTNLVSGNASGSWGAAANWNPNGVASGADNIADFSTLDLTTLSTVTLDGARTIGNVIFGDTTPSTNWVLATGSAGPLTLAVSSGSPTITANNGSNTISAVLTGTSGLTKAGSGTLRLNTGNPNLQNLILLNAGILQIGNAGAVGTNGNQTGVDRVICTNGATLEIINGVQPNNKHLTLSGTGVGGTQGALYANTSGNGTSTRWSLSTLNGSGTSANSSSSYPAVSLAGDTTIRIDGPAYTAEPTGASGPSFAIGYISTVNPAAPLSSILTKTGAGRLSLDRGVAGLTNVVVQAGSWMPNAASGLGAIQQYHVLSGAAILNNQNNCFSSSVNVQLDAGAFFDINWRGNGNVGSDTTTYSQNIGYLNGAGLLTTGARGNTGVQTLNIQGSDSNSVFSGTITVSNGTFNITKNGTATLTLSGNNNYNGTTTVNAGTLLVDGSHRGGAGYTVATGATLGGRGTILPTITINGALSAGDNGGTLTVSNVVGLGDVYVTNANLAVLGQLNSSASGSSLNSLNLTNGTVTALLQQNGTEASIYTIALNVDGTGNILIFTTANPATGQFPFIKYSSLGGLNGFAGLVLQPPTGITAYLSNNTVNSSIDIVVTGIPALVWRGTPTGDWTIGGSANWLNGATPAAYTETGGQGPFVIFDDTAPGSTSVNLAANVNPKGITVNSSTKNYTFSGSSSISCTGSVLKDGSSTLTLANNNSVSGTVTIANGALALGNGGTAGSLGTASVANSGQVIFNRSDDVTFPNAITGSGSLVKNNTDTVTLSGVGNIGGAIQANAGTLALAPSGTITVSGDVTGSGGFGINSAGKVALTSANVSYTGGSLIAGGGTLEFDSTLPPGGSIADNGTLAFGVGGSFSGNISGAGGVTLLNGASVVFGGANTYAGPTTVLGSGLLMAAAANYAPASVLVLGSTNGAADIGSANFTAGNPVLGGLVAGGNNTSGDTLSLSAGGPQVLTINGNVTVGNVGPAGASIYLPVTGTGASLVVNTNGGTIQIGLGATGSGVNPDNVFVDLSALDNFIANLGATGAVNLGTLNGSPGPSSGATVVNWFYLASVSNAITAGAVNIGAGGRQLVPELRLGAGTNVLNVGTLALGPGQGTGGRDGGYLHFGGGTGGLQLRASDGISRAVFNVGVNPATSTGASITNTVDFTGHPVDLLVSTLTIGDYNNVGIYQNTLSFDTGTLDAQATRLSVIRNTGNATAIANAALSSSTLNLGGGTVSLGPVSLTASAAPGALNITNATVTVNNITTTGSGGSTLTLSGCTLNLSLTNSGNPATAPIVANNFTAVGPVNLNVNGTNWLVGQFPLISYTGGIGGDGYSALHLVGLPSGVSGYLSNNLSNLSVDMVVTSAPPVINPNPTNITVSVSGNRITLGWDAGHLGWLLQSNGVSLLNPSAWVTIPGSGSTNQFTFPVDASRTNAFFRMVKP